MPARERRKRAPPLLYTWDVSFQVDGERPGAGRGGNARRRENGPREGTESGMNARDERSGHAEEGGGGLQVKAEAGEERKRMGYENTPAMRAIPGALEWRVVRCCVRLRRGYRL